MSNRILELDLGPNVTRSGFEALSKLSSLQEFLFLDSINEQQEHLLQDCFELMPQLQAVCGRSQKLRCHHDEAQSDWISEALLNLRAPCTLKLHKLDLTGSRYIPPGVELPEMQTLLLARPTLTQIELGVHHFAKLSELCVRDCVSEAQLLRILGQVGRQLETLHFTYCHLDVCAVLAAAPHLVNLAFDVPGLRCTTPLQPTTLQRLRTLSFVNDDRSPDSIEPGLLLLQLLRLAPKLRTVTAGFDKMELEDFMALVRLAQECTSMRRLEEFIVRLNDTNDFNSIYLAEQATCALAINCPHLRKACIGHVPNNDM